MRLTYHGVEKSYWDSQPAGEPYRPPGFEADGFVHTTEGREAVALVLTHLYGGSDGAFVVLHVDLDRIRVPWRYDDAAELFPHVYGPLSRDAIVRVEDAGRATDGSFLRPTAF